MKGIWEFFKEIGVATGITLVIDEVKKKYAAESAKAITEKFSDEHRAEVWAFILSLSDNGKKGKLAYDGFMRHQRERQNLAQKDYRKYKPGDENELNTLLAKLYFALNQSLDEKELRKKVFIKLGLLDDESFDDVIEALNHDAIKQWARRFWNYGKDIIAQADSEVKEHEKEIIAKIKRGGEKGAKALNSLDGWLAKKLPEKDPSIFRGVMGGVTALFRRKGAKNG